MMLYIDGIPILNLGDFKLLSCWTLDYQYFGPVKFLICKPRIMVTLADVKKIRIPGKRLLSNRKVRCLTNVEAFSLRATDLEEITSLFSRFFAQSSCSRSHKFDSYHIERFF